MTGPIDIMDNIPNPGRRRARTRRPFHLLLFSLLPLLAACSSQKGTTRDTEGSSQILQELRLSYGSTPDLTIGGTLKISGALATVWYDAVIRSRDSLKILMNGPFGIPVGALGATPKEFTFFNIVESEVLEGRPDRKTFSKMLMVAIDYDEMVALLRGELPRFPETGGYIAEAADDLLRFTVESGNTLERFTVNPSKLTVESYSRSRVFSDTTTEEISILYSNFRRLGGREFPRRAQVSIAGGTQSMLVIVDEMKDRADPGVSAAIDIPDGIPRRRL